jgi:hypothetical protein
MSADATLTRLAEILRADGGLLAAAVVDPAPGTPVPHGAAAAAGPRSAGHEAEIALVVEAIREGELLHYGRGRVVATDDRDLALLAGDRLYALGLDRLAALGDLDAVAELADVVALAAQAHAAGDAELADAIWEAGAHAVGHGGSPALEAAKQQARDGRPSAAGALRAAVRHNSADGMPAR